MAQFKTYYVRIDDQCNKEKKVKLDKEKIVLKYLSKKQYNKMLKENPDEREICVLGYSSLKEADNDKDDARMALSENAFADVNRKQKRFRRVYGYVPVGADKYIALQRLSIIPFLILFLMLLLVAFFCKSCVTDNTPWHPDIEPSISDTTDDNEPSQTQQNGITISGFDGWIVPAGKTRNISTWFANPAGNRCYFTFVVTLDETGEIICKSKMVPPGRALNKVTLLKALEPGEYPATIKILTNDVKTGDRMNDGRINIKITAR